MAKYFETTMPRKTMGLYLQLAKALNALQAAGEEVIIENYARPLVSGLTAEVAQDPATGEWSVVQA